MLCVQCSQLPLGGGIPCLTCSLRDPQTNPTTVIWIMCFCCTAITYTRSKSRRPVHHLFVTHHSRMHQDAFDLILWHLEESCCTDKIPRWDCALHSVIIAHTDVKHTTTVFTWEHTCWGTTSATYTQTNQQQVWFPPDFMRYPKSQVLYCVRSLRNSVFLPH